MDTDIKKIPEPIDNKDCERLCEIRFDCIVRMFDFGNKMSKGVLGQKPYPPQWFASQLNISLEEIKYSDEIEIGRMIKDAYRKLEEEIKKYEDG